MKQLDRDIQERYSRHWDAKEQAARGKQVILVEGDDDRDVVEELLRQRRETWNTRVRVVVAGGRTRVLELGRTRFPHAHMLVDRDTWTDDDVQRRADDRLLITAGWCLEDLFLDPDFLRTVDPRVADRVAAHRTSWVQAGALWWTLQRAREAQQLWQDALGWTYGAPRDDLDLRSADTVRATLRHEARLDIDALADGFDRHLQALLGLPEPLQWQRGVHGKEAFRRLLHPTLQASLGHRLWRIELAGKLGRPPPFDTLLALLFP